MNQTLPLPQRAGIAVPVTALCLYAVASGYLMSMLPLLLNRYALPVELAGWLASIFYAGLLTGTLFIEPLVKKTGHRAGFVLVLVILSLSVAVMPLSASREIWLAARFVAGLAVAGVFVIVESWLLSGDESQRAKRLALYMGALYGGSSVGQLGLGLDFSGTTPFAITIALFMVAAMVLFVAKPAQPAQEEHTALSPKQIMKLSKPAIVGCVVSGLTLGALYGLLPLELKRQAFDQSDIGKLMTVFIMGGMAVQPLVTILLRYMSRTLAMALFCLLGVAAIAANEVWASPALIVISLFLLGVAAFAVYPVAINLGCDKLGEQYIVSATQVMLFCYSVGSVGGPAIAQHFSLMNYLFIAFLTTAIYMLFASIKRTEGFVAQ